MGENFEAEATPISAIFQFDKKSTSFKLLKELSLYPKVGDSQFPAQKNNQVLYYLKCPEH